MSVAMLKMADFLEDPNQTVVKRVRKRKAYFRYIQKSVEFYLSDANLRNDLQLRNIWEKCPDFEPSFFLSFNRLRNIGAVVEDIRCALKPSLVLEFTPEGKIRRKFPIREKSKEEVDLCTLYAEQIPLDATTDMLNKIFSAFGTVAMVKLPKYKTSNKLKGFAFVEFESKTSAEAAVTTFTSHGGIINCHKNINDINPMPQQNICLDAESKLDIVRNILPPIMRPPIMDHRNALEAMAHLSSVHNMMSGQKRTKNRKKRKSQRKTKYMGIQIMPKIEWNRLRKLYLTLQTSNRHRIKTQLSKLKKSLPLPVSSSNFTPGCIVKVTFPKPVSETEIRNAKTTLKQFQTVEYIDMEPENIVGYVRMVSSDAAIWLINNHEVLPLCELEQLTSSSETAYWEKIERDRRNKFSKPNPSKIRGGDRLVARAEKQLGVKLRLTPDEVVL